MGGYEEDEGGWWLYPAGWAVNNLQSGLGLLGHANPFFEAASTALNMELDRLGASPAAVHNTASESNPANVFGRVFDHAGDTLETAEAGDKYGAGINASRTANAIVDSVFALYGVVGLVRGGCFTEGTEVVTENGLVAIEEVEPGDWVWAYDTESGETELREVLEISRRTAHSLVHLGFDSIEITTTDEHPFWVDGRGWTKASELVPGDLLWRLDAGTVELAHIEIEATRKTVFNLEVEGLSTYFVGEREILVHNSSFLSRTLSFGDDAVGWSQGLGKTFGQGARGAPKSALQTTAHGAERIAGQAATRGGVLSEAGVQAVRQGGRLMTQADGATVRILQNASGRFNVVVEGQRGIITTFENLSQKSLTRLGKNYGWK